MRKILSLSVLACLALGAAAPRAAFADEDDGSTRVGKDVFMSAGVKTWMATWQTNLTGSGVNWEQFVKGPVPAIIPNVSLRIHDFLLAGSYMATGVYHFPSDTIVVTNGGVAQFDHPILSGMRHEGDFNIGYYVSKNVLLTMGYKGIQETFSVTDPVFKTNTNSYVHYNGVTFGVAGSVPVGNGFSIYGNGVGGILFTTYTPNSSTYIDTAQYEASELGFAWKARNLPLSASLGYKFQLIETHINVLNSSAYSTLPRSDVTRGFMLGVSYVF